MPITNRWLAGAALFFLTTPLLRAQQPSQQAGLPPPSHPAWTGSDLRDPLARDIERREVAKPDEAIRAAARLDSGQTVELLAPLDPGLGGSRQAPTADAPLAPLKPAPGLVEPKAQGKPPTRRAARKAAAQAAELQRQGARQDWGEGRGTTVEDDFTPRKKALPEL